MLLLLALYYLTPAGAVPTPLPLPLPITDATAGSGATTSDCSVPTRTLLNIIWSCLSTILSCTWVAIHPNIPEPEEATENRATTWWSKASFSAKRFIRHKLTLFVTALLVPEYILAWAIRQWMCANDLKKAGKDKGWTRTHGYFILMGGFHLYKRGDDVQSDAKPAYVEEEIEWSRDAHKVPSIQPFDDLGIPVRPLDVETVLKLLQDGTLKLPTEQEIMDRSKTDSLSKVVVLGQTGWFILQCIARGVQHLSVTELEIVTLAYTSLAFWIYLAWWDKPRNIERPIRVYLSERQVTSTSTSTLTLEQKQDGVVNAADVAKDESSPFGDTLMSIASFIMGFADVQLDMKSVKGIPTFYSGRATEIQTRWSDTITLSFGVIFGAIHCIAWSFEFPTHTEQTLWRISAIAIIGVTVLIPITLITLLMSDELEESKWKILRACSQIMIALSALVLLISLFLGGLLYILARFTTLVLALMELRSLPHTAYQDVYWTSLLPHV